MKNLLSIRNLIAVMSIAIAVTFLIPNLPEAEAGRRVFRNIPPIKVDVQNWDENPCCDRKEGEWVQHIDDMIDTAGSHEFTYDIPDGKRLIIEYISVQVDEGPIGGLELDYDLKIRTIGTFGGNTIAFTISGKTNRITQGDPFRDLTFSTSTDICFDARPNSDGDLRAIVTPTINAFPPVKNKFYQWSFKGRLVDIPES